MFSGVLADLKPVQIWTPGPNPLALPKCFKTESRLLYLFYNKESVKFPKNYFQFSKQQCRQHALYSHKSHYNKPIRIPVRMVQIIWWSVKNVKPSKFIFWNSLQTKIARHFEYNTFAWSFLVSVKFGPMVAPKNTQLISYEKKKTKCSRRVFYEWTTAEFTRTWRSIGMTAP